jgi:hypothetical protein
LTLLNTTLNAIPMFAMCTLKMPITIFNILRKVVENSYGPKKMNLLKENARPVGI